MKRSFDVELFFIFFCAREWDSVQRQYLVPWACLSLYWQAGGTMHYLRISLDFGASYLPPSLLIYLSIHPSTYPLIYACATLLL
jgi:hypothetical protein